MRKPAPYRWASIQSAPTRPVRSKRSGPRSRLVLLSSDGSGQQTRAGYLARLKAKKKKTKKKK